MDIYYYNSIFTYLNLLFMLLLDKELKKLGLKEKPIVKDENITYRSFEFSANESYILINNILNTAGSVIEQVFSINDREIKKPLTLKQVENFIDIIQ